jgi:hypothetical protein
VTINWGPLGAMPKAKAASKPLLVQAAEALHAALGLHCGRLERPLSMTTASGPVGLGFLGLTLEMFSSRLMVEQVAAEVHVAWSFGQQHLRLDIGGTLHPPVGEQLGFKFGAVLQAGNLAPGILTLNEVMLSQPVRVRTKKGERYRLCSVGHRLRIVGEGAPTGSVPAVHHGAFLPLAV